MRSLCLVALSFFFLLAGCSAKGLEHSGQTSLEVNMGSDCTAQLFSNEHLKYSFNKFGKYTIEKGNYVIKAYCPNSKTWLEQNAAMNSDGYAFAVGSPTRLILENGEIKVIEYN